MSNILQTLNDAYQTDFTEEDKVDLEVIRQKIQQNPELRLVIDGDNTESNKRYKFEQTLDEILLGFVTNKLELYTKLSKPNVKSFLPDQLYNDCHSPVRDWDLDLKLRFTDLYTGYYFYPFSSLSISHTEEIKR